MRGTYLSCFPQEKSTASPPEIIEFPVVVLSLDTGKIGENHRLNNYKDTKPYMPSLLVFNRVYRLEIHSVMFVF